MARILLIETATARLSVALAENGMAVASRVCDEPRQQASLTAPLVKEVLDSQGLRVSDCDAVCVSKGPGSYTGLRVGVSTAKGLAFGAGIPLLAVGTLDILAQAAPSVIPMAWFIVDGEIDPDAAVRNAADLRAYLRKKL